MRRRLVLFRSNPTGRRRRTGLKLALLLIAGLLLSSAEPLATLIGPSAPGTSNINRLGALQGDSDVDINPKMLDVIICPGERKIEKILVSSVDKRPIDLFLLIDTTQSYASAINRLKETANQLVDGLKDLRQRLSPDPNFIQIGLGEFRDYPFVPWGDPRNDYAYRLDLDLTPLSSAEKIGAIMDKINALSTSAGGDAPESQLPALLQAATGRGQDLNEDGDFTDFGEIPPGQGASFRPGSRRIIILATDASCHDPENTSGYFGPSFPEAMAALKAKGILVYGLFSDAMSEDSEPARAHLRRIARETMAFAGAGGFQCDGEMIQRGQPIVCTLPADGDGIAKSIVTMATPGTRMFQLERPSPRPSCLVSVSEEPPGSSSFAVELTCPADGQMCSFGLNLVEVLPGNPPRPIGEIPVTVRCGPTLIIPGPLPPGVDFGNILVNTSSTRMVPLQNKGKADLVVTKFESSRPAFVVRTPVPLTLRADEVRDITIDFACGSEPDSMPQEGVITVISNACNSPMFTFPVKGRCITQPPPCLTISPNRQDFGNVPIDERRCQDLALTVNNVCATPVTVTNLSTSVGTDFSIAGTPTIPPLPLVIPPMGSAMLRVTVCFTPSAVGLRTGGLTLSGTSGVGDQAGTVALTGIGVAVPMISLVCPSTFQVAPAGEQCKDVIIGNKGTRLSVLEVTKVEITQAEPVFVLDPAPSLPLRIPQGEQRTVRVCFRPPREGSFTGTLTITSNDPAQGTVGCPSPLTGTTPPRSTISGTGDALILGYYDLERFDVNHFNVINTGGVWLQARIRLREAGLSNDVVNFPIVLSPNDLFFFEVKRDAQGNLFLESTDSGTLNHTETFVKARAGLVPNVQFDGRTARITPPGGNKFLGYVEVFGEAVFGGPGPGGAFRPFNQFQPIPGGGFFPGPAGTSTFTWAAVQGGLDGNVMTQDLGDAPDVLMGGAFLVDVMNQFWTRYNGLAIEKFRTTSGVHARDNYPLDSGVILVDENCLPFPINGLFGNVFCFPDGDVGARLDDGDGGIANINSLFFSDFATHFFNRPSGMGNRTDLIILFPTKKYGGLTASTVQIRAFDTNENAVGSISPIVTFVFPDELNFRSVASLGVPPAVTEGWIQIAFADGAPALGFVLNSSPTKSISYFPAAKGSRQAPGRIGRAP